MPIIRWEPIEAVDRFFGDHPLKIPKLGWDLAVDVFEEDADLVAKMSLPGIDAEDISINVAEGSLTIAGEREEEEEVESKEYYTKEIRRGSFSRTIELPKRVDPSRTEADYEDGVLTVVMPVVAPKKGETVQVRVGKE